MNRKQAFHHDWVLAKSVDGVVQLVACSGRVSQQIRAAGIDRDGIAIVLNAVDVIPHANCACRAQERTQFDPQFNFRHHSVHDSVMHAACGHVDAVWETLNWATIGKRQAQSIIDIQSPSCHGFTDQVADFIRPVQNVARTRSAAP